MGLNDSKQLVVGRRRRWGGVRHHLAPPLMDLELLEEVPLSQPDHGTRRNLSAGRLLPLCSRLWWAMLWGGCPSSPRGHCLWAQPGVTPYFSPPLAAGPGHAPSHARGEGGSRIPPQQVKSRVLFWGQSQLGPCGPRLALVRPSGGQHCPPGSPLLALSARLCLPLSAGGFLPVPPLPARSVFHCSTRILPGRGRVWGPTSWVGALLHTVGGVAWFFFSLSADALA